MAHFHTVRPSGYVGSKHAISLQCAEIERLLAGSHAAFKGRYSPSPSQFVSLSNLKLPAHLEPHLRLQLWTIACLVNTSYAKETGTG